MVARKAIEILAPGRENGPCSTPNREIIGLEIQWTDRSIGIHAAVSDEPATLADIVPLARTISDRIAAASVEKHRRDKCRIPCRKGCSACCSYLVPISVPEAIRLGYDIRGRNAHEQKKMIRSSLLAARRILKHEPPAVSLDESVSEAARHDTALQNTSDWYRNLDVTCPFLVNRACSIYAQRPLACREHMVEGTSAGCSGVSDDSEVVRPPLRMVEVLGQLAAELEAMPVEAVILPLAVAWNEINAERADRCWPAPMMVRRLFQLAQAACRKEPQEVFA